MWCDKVEVDMLQFADDIIFFLQKISLQNILCIKSMLRGIELASSLKVNFHKSSLAGIGMKENVVDRYDALLNCKIMSIPFIYLGIQWEPIREGKQHGHRCYKGCKRN